MHGTVTNISLASIGKHLRVPGVHDNLKAALAYLAGTALVVIVVDKFRDLHLVSSGPLCVRQFDLGVSLGIGEVDHNQNAVLSVADRPGHEPPGIRGALRVEPGPLAVVVEHIAVDDGNQAAVEPLAVLRALFGLSPAQVHVEFVRETLKLAVVDELRPWERLGDQRADD